MNQIIRNLDCAGLVIKVVIAEEKATLVWSGYSEMREPDNPLNPFFKDLLLVLKGKRLTVDFRLFEFMSSATQAPILQFLKALDRSQIPTRVIYNTNIEWQRISYRCMKVLFRSMPTIQFDCL